MLKVRGEREERERKEIRRYASELVERVKMEAEA